jgi:hypothetical protein
MTDQCGPLLDYAETFNIKTAPDPPGAIDAGGD